MINHSHSERRKSIFYIFQPLVYTNKHEIQHKDKIQHDYNIDFDKEILKRTKKKNISFFKKYFSCMYDQKTQPEIKT